MCQFRKSFVAKLVLLLAATRLHLDRDKRQRRKLLRLERLVERHHILFVQLPPLHEIRVERLADLLDPRPPRARRPPTPPLAAPEQPLRIPLARPKPAPHLRTFPPTPSLFPHPP